MIGCIIGTGTNACYVERADAVQKWTDPLPNSGEMVRPRKITSCLLQISLIYTGLKNRIILYAVFCLGRCRFPGYEIIFSNQISDRMVNALTGD